MKTTVIALACVCFAFSALAQASDFASVPVQGPLSPVIDNPAIISPVVNQAPTRITLAPGLRMKKVGQTMTFCGALLFVGGIAVISSADPNYGDTHTRYTSSGQYEEDDPKYTLGAAMLVHGVGLTVPGIIFWNKGNKKFNRWTEEQRQQNLSLGLGGSGVGMRYRF